MYDRAQDLAELERISCVALHTGKGDYQEVKAVGHCVYCELDIPVDSVNQRFCDSICRDLFEFDKKRGIKL